MLELSAGFGRRHWWPAASPFEVAVGAILTQNTAWRNVELALANLRAVGALEPAVLLALPPSTEAAGQPKPGKPSSGPSSLEALIRPSGFFRTKATKLRALTTWWLAQPGGAEATLATRPLADLRPELLAIHGVGPETADSILCYAGGRPVAIVDAYTRRVLARHHLVPHAAKASYEELRAWLAARLAPDQLVREEFHALVVAAGYDNCKPTPNCATCPASDPDKL
ncbi:MAG: endonuclease [Planctomycetota bacterium]|nr:endonuclease [Planctomycetota bacterium]